MAVLLQIASVLVLAIGAALVAGWSSATYVVLGGAAAIIPNSLFALRLAFHRERSAESYPVVFFLGQFGKIGLTVGLLAAIHKWLGPLQWLPLLLGLIVALKAPLFALLYVRSLPEAEPLAELSAGSKEAGSKEAGRDSSVLCDSALRSGETEAREEALEEALRKRSASQAAPDHSAAS